MEKQTGTRRTHSLGRWFNYANNALSLAGIAMTTVAAITIVVFVIAEAAGAIHNPYVASFAFLVLPGFFVLGLVLIPLGMWRRRRRLLRSGATRAEIEAYPRLDFNSPELRRVAAIVLILTAVNGVILGSSSYLAVEEMDSVEFCGAVCHTVMQPEYTAYQQSPHSRVQCVECHIGPGASWFVKAKLDGLRQVWHTALDTFPRPIESPIANLRPARETCESCHWPAKHYGDKLRVFARFAADEASTPSYTAMLLKTGGGALDTGSHGGIHWWHIYADNRIRYLASDARRQEIAWVELTTPDGEVVTYTRDGAEPPDAATIAAEARVMDCIDCHNRPTHLFQVPAKALDAVLERTPELRQLPYYKKQALAAVTGSYPTREAGLAAVRDAVTAYYRDSYPEIAAGRAGLVARGAEAAALVYGRSVFPEMNTNWDTHPNNIGHDDFPGCWRCHGGEMTSSDGERMISPDCDTCHTVLVEDSAERPDFAALIAGQG